MDEIQETQYEAAQRMYRDRATSYEDSWHPAYSQRFMKIAAAKSGERILSLACGTGLEANLAAPLIGDEGVFIGVDATEDMLDVARQKLENDAVLKRRVNYIKHDATNLDNCSELKKQSFDVILCSNAFVLFPNPAKVVEHWREFLKPGGRMIIDITHEGNLPASKMLERVAQRMNIMSPSSRLWIKSKETFKDILEANGLTVERIETLEKQPGKGTMYWDAEEVDAQFDWVVNAGLTKAMTTEDFKVKARPLFREEWDASVVDGKIEVTDLLYVYVARKAL